MAVLKGRKKCVVGKNCGGSCINRQKICQMELRPSYQELLKQVVGKLSDERLRPVANTSDLFKFKLPGPETKPAGLETQLAKAKEDFARVAKKQMKLLKEGKKDEALKLNAELRPAASLARNIANKIDFEKAQIVQSGSVGTRIARGDAKSFDRYLEAEKLDQIGPTIDWNKSKESGSKNLGTGSYGSVVKTPDGKEAHKRGEIGENETAILKKVGDAGVGPKMLGAELNGPGKQANTRKGRIAMEALDATPLREHPPDFKISGRNASDIYWETRAAVHRLGIQHNDMHVMNILVGENGKGKIIDMGLSKDNPRAALSEALGAFGRNGGDWQYKRWGSTGGQLLSKVEEGLRPPNEVAQQTPVLAKVVNNKAKVEKEMQNMGLSPSEISEIGATPIRSDDKVYSSGPFAKLDDEKAMRLVNMLYEGV